MVYAVLKGEDFSYEQVKRCVQNSDEPVSKKVATTMGYIAQQLKQRDPVDEQLKDLFKDFGAVVADDEEYERFTELLKLTTLPNSRWTMFRKKVSSKRGGFGNDLVFNNVYCLEVLDGEQWKTKAVWKLGRARACLTMKVAEIAHHFGLGKHVSNGFPFVLKGLSVPDPDSDQALVEEGFDGGEYQYLPHEGSEESEYVGCLEPWIELVEEEEEILPGQLEDELSSQITQISLRDSPTSEELFKFGEVVYRDQEFLDAAKLVIAALMTGAGDLGEDNVVGYVNVDTGQAFRLGIQPCLTDEPTEAPTHMPILGQPIYKQELPGPVIEKLLELADSFDPLGAAAFLGESVVGPLRGKENLPEESYHYEEPDDNGKCLCDPEEPHKLLSKQDREDLVSRWLEVQKCLRTFGRKHLRAKERGLEGQERFTIEDIVAAVDPVFAAQLTAIESGEVSDYITRGRPAPELAGSPGFKVHYDGDMPRSRKYSFGSQRSMSTRPSSPHSSEMGTPRSQSSLGEPTSRRTKDNNKKGQRSVSFSDERSPDRPRRGRLDSLVETPPRKSRSDSEGMPDDLLQELPKMSKQRLGNEGISSPKAMSPSTTNMDERYVILSSPPLKSRLESSLRRALFDKPEEANSKVTEGEAEVLILESGTLGSGSSKEGGGSFLTPSKSTSSA